MKIPNLIFLNEDEYARLTRNHVGAGIVLMLGIRNRLAELVSHKVYALKRHVHRQLSCVTSVKCEYTFGLVNVSYTGYHVSVR